MGISESRVYASLAVFCWFSSHPSARVSPSHQSLTRPVNDFANVIDATSEAELERRILELKKASGDVVVVATIETFQPSYADIEEYAVKMFENRGRGIGEKGKDNGLLVLLAVKDRRVWAEVGYDLEQFITTAMPARSAATTWRRILREASTAQGCSRASRASSDESRRAAALRSPAYRCPRRRAGPGRG